MSVAAIEVAVNGSAESSSTHRSALSTSLRFRVMRIGILDSGLMAASSERSSREPDMRWYSATPAARRSWRGLREKLAGERGQALRQLGPELAYRFERFGK
jgi:hypothetical protein